MSAKMTGKEVIVRSETRTNVVIKRGGSFYKLVYFAAEPRDGSFYIGLKCGLKGKNATRAVSYHSSGLIRYKRDDKVIESAFMEPLAKITQTVMFFAVSPPELTRLRKQDRDGPNDVIVELPDSLVGRIDFDF
jgi:hypothetical protein